MNGARIGITATRRADAQEALVRSLGGVPVHGPSIEIDVPAPDATLVATVEALLAATPDIAVFVTGVGARHILSAADRAGLLAPVLEVLRATRVVVRGIKPRRVLREFEVPIAWTAAPPESRVIRDVLLAEGVEGRRILVQCAGARADVMVAPLRAAGADVLEAHPYTLDVPPDGRGAVELARAALEGRLDAITFTSAHAVNGFVALAERAGIDAADLAATATLFVAVGPVTREAMLSEGLPVHVEPEAPRMGAMFQQLAATLRAAPRPSAGRPGP